MSRYFSSFFRHRTRVLLSLAIGCGALGAWLGLYGDSEASYPMAAVMIGISGLAQGQLLFVLHRALLNPSTRLSTLKIGQVFPPVRVLLLAYAFTAGGTFVVVAAIVSAVSNAF